MLDLPIPWQSNLNGTSCFTKVTSSTLGTFLIFEKAWAGVGLWRMSIDVYIIHFIQYKMNTIYLDIEKYLGKSNQENCVPKKVIRMGKKMATFCRNGRKQWWRRRAGDPLWTSGFLPPPEPPPTLSACGAPPLRNHSICVPYSLIAVISQTQSHPLLSNKFLWNKVTLQAEKSKYKYETMNCCGVHSKALNGRGHGTAQHRVNRIIE